ncbi:hypothetical protein VR41_10395 [Streptomyces sp. NRRL B-1568]|nr:hypothetical protein VR41_10395 [Streptomyces sp. NRRL B-1568]
MKRSVRSGPEGSRPSRLWTRPQDAGDPGPSLAEIVDAVGPLPEESVLWLAVGLAGALAGLHRAGRVHGDVQPGNVLLTRNGPRLAYVGGNGTPGAGEPARLPVQKGRPHEPSADMMALGMLLVTAYTGTVTHTAPLSPYTSYPPDTGAPAEPDISTLPVRLRQVVAVCLAKESGPLPTPAQLLDLVGPLTDASHAWSPEVNELIARRQVDKMQLGRAVAELASPQVDEPGGAAEPPRGPDTASASPKAARLRLVVFALAVALVSAIITALVMPVPDHGGGTRVAEAPQSGQPSPWQPTAPDTPREVPREAPQESAPEQEPSREPATTLTSEVPTAPTTRQTQQTGVINDCQGEPLSEPTTLLLACGDAGRMLQNLTWTGWGGATATAQGTVWEKLCVPNCVTGRRASSPATVTVSGLVGGRYTVMELSAPQSPLEPVARYTLDERGPTDRS